MSVFSPMNTHFYFYNIMQNLQFLNQNWVIIFYDNSHKFITEIEANLIFDTKDKSIIIRGAYITIGAISKIISKNDFYQEYPKHKPVPSYPKLPPPLGVAGIVVSTKVRRQIESMIAGMKKYLEENSKGTSAPIELLKKMEARLTGLRQKVKIIEDV